MWVSWLPLGPGTNQGCVHKDSVGPFHHLRLITGCFIEAAGVNEILKVRLIQGFCIRDLCQDIDVVEAVPLPHGIHPRGVRLVEAILVVFTALLREGENRVREVTSGR